MQVSDHEKKYIYIYNDSFSLNMVSLNKILRILQTTIKIMTGLFNDYLTHTNVWCTNYLLSKILTALNGWKSFLCVLKKMNDGLL